MEVLKSAFDIEKFQPGIYLYLGRYQCDRDIKILGWFGPFSSGGEARQNIPDWWRQDGLENPRVLFRIFCPRNLVKYE